MKKHLAACERAEDLISNILIADDHALIRRGLRDLLEQETGFFVCGVAEDLSEVEEKLKSHEVDIVVLDLGLGDGNGIDAIRDIRAANPRLKILVSSMRDETLFAVPCIRAGANGFISKAESLENLVDAIVRILDGDTAVSKPVSNQLSASRNEKKNGIESLSKREMQVFEMIGKGMSTKEIAAELFRSPKTIDSFRERIKQKLNITSADELRCIASVSVN